MVIFHSYVSLPEGNDLKNLHLICTSQNAGDSQNLRRLSFLLQELGTLLGGPGDPKCDMPNDYCK